MIFSQKLKNLRKERNITQQELADAINISRSTIAGYEIEDKQPSYEVIAKIAKYFSVSTDYLLGVESKQEGDKDLPWRYAHAENRFGGILEDYRKQNKISAEALSKRLGISLETYSGLEFGAYLPTMKLLKKVSETTGLEMDYLTGAVSHTTIPTKDVLPLGAYEIPISQAYCDFTFCARFEDLCLEHSIDHENCEEKLSLSKAEYTDIKFNRMPTLSELLKLSYAFDVSMDFLIGRIDDKAENALHGFCKLNADNQDIVVGDIKKYLKEQRHEESVAADAHLKKAIGK